MTVELFGRTFRTRPGQEQEVHWWDDPRKVRIYEDFVRKLEELRNP